ncbi:uncharacterized protein LOC127754726 [Oryza glaberrima]|uniref:uncharacterized protein LOC127754726 n=1 Tax=Oryza glaberrima TaxID=4538 RepID=UPI00023DFD87|nr:uncharacterized protein LOC127754726 [Oryza glaberrima]
MEAPSPSPAKSQQVGSPRPGQRQPAPERATESRTGAAADEPTPEKPVTGPSAYARAASESTKPVTGHPGQRGNRIWRLRRPSPSPEPTATGSPTATPPSRWRAPPPHSPIATTSPSRRHRRHARAGTRRSRG